MKIAIFGGRGSGEDAAQSIARLVAGGAALEIAGYLNDQLSPGTPLLGGRVLGRFEEWTALQEDVRFVAPLHKPGQMQVRLGRIEELGVPRERWATVLDPNTVIASSATVGAGVVTGPFAVVGPGSSLGMHSVVRAQAQVSHDVTLGDFVFIGGGSVVSGYCRLDVGAYVGPGAVLRDSISVGRFAVVGVGAVVVADVPDFVVVAGNPARPLSQAR